MEDCQKIIFLSFADLTGRRGLRRIGKQARRLGIFDEIVCATEADLGENFKSKFSRLLREDVSGFGYWLWKPEIIWSQLSRMEENDLLVYLDAGCHLNPKGMSRLLDYIKIVNNSESGLLVTQLDLPEKNWTKSEIFHFFGRAAFELLETNQIQAGIILLRKTENAESIIHKWRKIAHDHPDLFDNFYDEAGVPSTFESPRNDQSIFSILCKLASFESISYLETQPGLDRGKWRDLKHFPIHARRARFKFWEKVIRKLFA